MSLISGIELADSPHPMTIGVPPTHWYEPDEVTDVSGNASEIRCKAGSGDTLSQGTSSYRPSINASGWNGKQTLSFATNKNLYKIGGLSGLPTGDNDRTLIVCVKDVTLNAGNPYNHITHYGDLSTNSSYGICPRLNSAGGPFTNWGNHYWDSGYNTGDSGTSGNIIIMKLESGVDYGYIDGSAATNASHDPPTLTTTADEFRIGSRVNDPNAISIEDPSAFAFGGVALYDYALSDYQLSGIVRYYKNKYAIA